jgi:TonB family protein
VFHAAVIGLVVSLFAPVEFQVYEKVTDVIIASPSRIRIPSSFLPLTQREDVASEDVFKADPNRAPASAARGTAEGESEFSPRRTAIRGRLSQEKIATPPPELASKFRLDSTQSAKSGFTLNINPAETKAAEEEREISLDELNLLGYLQSDPAQTRPIRGDPSRTIRAGISGDQTAAGDVIEYDITPWAESAIARVQRNWAIPPRQGNEEKKAVEISVSIAKSGELLSFEIRNSSGIPALDLAALRAINLSTPFPQLPDDFPLDRLDADLLFQYYE